MLAGSAGLASDPAAAKLVAGELTWSFRKAWDAIHPGQKIDSAGRISLAQSDDTKVKDILPQIQGRSRDLIDPRIREDDEITLGQINEGVRTGKLPSGQAIGKARFKTAKKVLTAGRMKKK